MMHKNNKINKKLQASIPREQGAKQMTVQNNVSLHNLQPSMGYKQYVGMSDTDKFTISG